VYFLFLAVDKISNLGIWKTFFSHAPRDMYRAFVHCKDQRCSQQVVGSPIELVPTVPSYYCTDLVSPMQQLLHYALSADPQHSHPSDKFAFISDSSLPGKPFAHVHSALTGRVGSDFCVFPSREWADVNTHQGLSILVKHHQWVTLDRTHAARSSTLWSTGKMHDLMSRFRMNTMRWTWANNTFADGRNFGCLDEFWHMGALYGPLDHVNVHQDTISLPMFAGGPLRINHEIGWQGTCDTFVVWAKYLGQAGGMGNPFQRLHESLDQPSIPHGGNSQRPGWWDKMSTTGIKALRNSDFLFIRKFTDQPYLTDGGSFEQAYIRHVLM
jgi:hypothetical protein